MNNIFLKSIKDRILDTLSKILSDLTEDIASLKIEKENLYKKQNAIYKININEYWDFIINFEDENIEDKVFKKSEDAILFLSNEKKNIQEAIKPINSKIKKLEKDIEKIKFISKQPEKISINMKPSFVKGKEKLEVEVDYLIRGYKTIFNHYSHIISNDLENFIAEQFDTTKEENNKLSSIEDNRVIPKNVDLFNNEETEKEEDIFVEEKIEESSFEDLQEKNEILWDSLEVENKIEKENNYEDLDILLNWSTISEEDDILNKNNNIDYKSEAEDNLFDENFIDKDETEIEEFDFDFWNLENIEEEVNTNLENEDGIVTNELLENNIKEEDLFDFEEENHLDNLASTLSTEKNDNEEVKLENKENLDFEDIFDDINIEENNSLNKEEISVENNNKEENFENDLFDEFSENSLNEENLENQKTEIIEDNIQTNETIENPIDLDLSDLFEDNTSKNEDNLNNQEVLETEKIENEEVDDLFNEVETNNNEEDLSEKEENNNEIEIFDLEKEIEEINLEDTNSQINKEEDLDLFDDIDLEIENDNIKKEKEDLVIEQNLNVNDWVEDNILDEKKENHKIIQPIIISWNNPETISKVLNEVVPWMEIPNLWWVIQGVSNPGIAWSWNTVVNNNIFEKEIETLMTKNEVLDQISNKEIESLLNSKPEEILWYEDIISDTEENKDNISKQDIEDIELWEYVKEKKDISNTPEFLEFKNNLFNSFKEKELYIFPNEAFQIKKEWFLDRYSKKEKIYLWSILWLIVVILIVWVIFISKYIWAEEEKMKEIQQKEQTTKEKELELDKARKELEELKKQNNKLERQNKEISWTDWISLGSIVSIKMDTKEDKNLIKSSYKDKYLNLTFKNLELRLWGILEIELNSGKNLVYRIEENTPNSSIPEIANKLEKTNPTESFIILSDANWKYAIAKPLK